MGRGQIPEGKYTASVYGWIQEGRYQDAIDVLTMQLQYTPDSRAALSLLGYCHFQAGNFEDAAPMYRRLSELYPDSEEYRLYLAQSLYKAELFQEALKAAAAVPGAKEKVQLLQFGIKYEQGELGAAKQMLDKLPDDDGHTSLNQGCVLFKEGKYDVALKKFQDASNALGSRPQLSYNIAVCHFRLKQYGDALRSIADIIERGVREHPELNVGGYMDDTEARSVGNSKALRDSALVEAFNLKAAIEYVMKNYEVAREAMRDMPPRKEEELDTVTLHNMALLNMDTNPTEGFKKLNYLLTLPASPPETFSNLLLLYCKPTHAFYDMAADVMAEYEAQVDKSLTEDLREFLNASITKQSSAEEAYRKFDALGARYVDKLRRLTKTIGEARQERNNDKLTAAISQYDVTLEAYVPVVMAMAHLYWEAENYPQVMAILKQSMDLCSDHEVWKLNVAHALFMQKEYKDSLRYYEQVVRERSADSILDVAAMVLANECVSHIMLYQNEQAEEVMKRIERDENKALMAEPDKQPFHRCIVKLVIGTLYCANHNYEFGVGCIIKALEPMDKKLSPDTWFHAKRCVVAMVELIAKHILIIEDKTYAEVMAFLDEAERLGAKIETTFGEEVDGNSKRTVAAEARLIKQLLMRMRE